MAFARVKSEDAESLLEPRPDSALAETSDEVFDRIEFARRALDLLRPPQTSVALCGNASRMRIEKGRHWGRGPDESWALVAIPPRASRRAIALAVAELARTPAPFAFDLLFA